ncbi:hypothetical protein AUJ68_00830 [Candidatus Woesearchaeota archaeon CG1_02_57_44]|nr:MAG: hypothetical protein AUJ68_00830 [Candidatus Woesearchaeota archaeon CG1_02_57_44]
MKKTITTILAALAVVALVGGVVFLRADAPRAPPPTATTEKTNAYPDMPSGGMQRDQAPPSVPDDASISAPSSGPAVTMAELATHNSQEDCWVGFEGKAYDITAFLPNHPGSAEAIAPYCGTEKEFTAAFTGKHGMGKIDVLMQEGIYQGDI